MTEQLNFLRTAWEKGAISALEFPQNEQTFFVLVEFKDNHFELYRYFSIGSKWAVSSDCNDGILKNCLTKLSEMMRVFQ